VKGATGYAKATREDNAPIFEESRLTRDQLLALKPGQRIRRDGAYTTAPPRYYTLLDTVKPHKTFLYVEAMERGQTRRDIFRLAEPQIESVHIGWEN